MKRLLGKIVGAPNALVRAVAEKLLVGWLRDAGAGKHGPFALKVYDAAKGLKSYTGLLLGLLGFTFSSMGYSTEANSAYALGGLLLSVGLADKAVNTPGRPELLSNNALYRFLADNSGTIFTAMGGAYAYVQAPGCTSKVVFGQTITCTLMGDALAALSFAFLYLGIFDHALQTPTPAAVKAAMAPKENP